MKNVEIWDERKKTMLTRFREISIAQKELEEACKHFGPGKYFARWWVQENQGEGKGRKRQKIDREIFIYPDDMPEDFQAPVLAQGRPPARPLAYYPHQRAGITAEDIRAILQEAIKPLAGRLDELESGDDDDEEEDDDDGSGEEQPPEIFVQLLTIGRKPSYSRIVGALLSNADDQTKFAQVDAAFAENPQLKQELFFDVLSLVPKGFLGGGL